MNGDLNANGIIVGGMVGQRGAPGADAKINGYNTLTITGGTNISILQSDDTLTIENTYNDTDILADIDDLQENKANSRDLAEVATSGSYADLTNKPTDLSDFTNDEGFIDNTVSNLTNYTLATGTGHSIELAINTSTYVMTLNLKNEAGTTISTDSIDLPLESVVVSGSYDNVNKNIVLTLKDGSTVDIPVGDLVSGLQTEITSSNKLNSDYVDDTGHTNKFVTSSDISTWNGKQDALVSGTNIKTINSTTILGSGNFALESLSNKVTSMSGSSTNDQYPSAKLVYDQLALKENVSNKVTSISNTSTDTQYPSAKCVYDSQALQDTAITNLDTKVDNEVASLQAELDKYKMLENALPKVEGEGESITLDNTAQCPMKMDFKGQIQQDSTSISGGDEYDSPSPDHPQPIHIVSGDNEIKVAGENLLLNATWNVGKYLTNGNSVANDDGWSYCDYVDIENANYYYSPNSGNSPKTILYDIDKNVIQVLSLELSKTYDISSYNAKYIRVSVSNAAISYVKVYKEYAKEINLPVENLFDKDNANYIDAYINSSTMKFALSSTVKTYYISCKPNTTYTISKTLTAQFRVGTSASTPVVDGTLLQAWNGNSATQYTLTTNASANYLCICVRNSSSDTKTEEEVLASVQIEKGTKANSYTPYGTTPIEVGGIGEYEDEFFKNTIDSEYYDSTLELEKWYLKKKTAKIKLTSDMTWYKSGTTTVDKYYTRLSYDWDSTLNRSGSLCNYFHFKTNGTNIGEFDYSQNSNKLALFFCFASYNTSDINSFKNWLDNNDLYCIIPIPTPTNILLNDTLQETLDSFYSWQEQTNISQENNDIPFVIKASAIYDLTDLVNRVATLEAE